jgi:hypothetical protein
MGPEAAASVLRSAGQRMAELMRLPPVASIEALELEMNAALADIGWGAVALAVNESERCVELRHAALPRVGSAGEPPGNWLVPALEGLYEAWMAQQPGSDASFRSRLHQAGDLVVIRYGRV